MRRLPRRRGQQGQEDTIGLILIIAGLLLWLLGGYFIIGIVLIVIGLVLLFAPYDGAYGYTRYRGRRGPL